MLKANEKKIQLSNDRNNISACINELGVLYIVHWSIIFTNGTIDAIGSTNGIIGAIGSTIGTIGCRYLLGFYGHQWYQWHQWPTNGEITNGTIGGIPNVAHIIAVRCNFSGLVRERTQRPRIPCSHRDCSYKLRNSREIVLATHYHIKNQ